MKTSDGFVHVGCHSHTVHDSVPNAYYCTCHNGLMKQSRLSLSFSLKPYYFLGKVTILIHNTYNITLCPYFYHKNMKNDMAEKWNYEIELEM